MDVVDNAERGGLKPRRYRERFCADGDAKVETLRE